VGVVLALLPRPQGIKRHIDGIPTGKKPPRKRCLLPGLPMATAIINKARTQAACGMRMDRNPVTTLKHRSEVPAMRRLESRRTLTSMAGRPPAIIHRHPDTAPEGQARVRLLVSEEVAAFAEQATSTRSTKATVRIVPAETHPLDPTTSI
jgi:hypothetical protein